MFMHMPVKSRVVVLIAVAVCVGAFYVLVVRSEAIGDWVVHQGTGRLERDPQSGIAYLDVSYTVIQPGKPLFSFDGITCLECDNAPAVMTLEYRSEHRAALLVEVTERDGSVYRARLRLERSETWRRLELDPGEFRLRSGAEGGDENGRVDLGELKGRMEFYDDSTVKTPSTAFSNRLMLTPPRIITVEKKPVGGTPE